jgi:hypothetical protein
MTGNARYGVNRSCHDAATKFKLTTPAAPRQRMISLYQQLRDTMMVHITLCADERAAQSEYERLRLFEAG